MAEVVEFSTSKLNESDLYAIVGYLKQVPSANLDAAVTSIQPGSLDMVLGKAIYIDHCAACHQVSGEPVPHIFAPLNGSAIVQAQDPLGVVRLILQGARTSIMQARPTPFGMPAFDWKLDDEQIANVAIYVRNA